MDAFELIHPAFGSSQRFPLEQLFAAVRPDAAIRSPHVRYLLFFASLPAKFLFQNERHAYAHLSRLAKRRPMGRRSAAPRFEQGADPACYAAIAWRIEQLFSEAERTEDESAALKLNDEAAYYLSCLLSCMTPLNALLIKAARNLMGDEVYEGAGVSVDVSILGDLWDLNPLWLNHQTLGLRGPEDQIEAFYRVAIMKPRGFYDAVSRALGCGCNGREASARYGLSRSALRYSTEAVDELSPGFYERCLATHLQRAYRVLNGPDVIRALRPVFISPFAALWESGALAAVRPKGQAITFGPDSSLDALLQEARERLEEQRTAA